MSYYIKRTTKNVSFIHIFLIKKKLLTKPIYNSSAKFL